MRFDIFTYILARDKLGQKNALPFLGFGNGSSAALRMISAKNLSDKISLATRAKEVAQIAQQEESAQKTEALKEKSKALEEKGLALEEKKQALKEKNRALKKSLAAKTERDAANSAIETAIKKLNTAEKRAEEAELEIKKNVTENLELVSKRDLAIAELNETKLKLEDVQAQLQHDSELENKIEELTNIVIQDQVELAEIQRLYRLLQEKFPIPETLAMKEELQIFKSAYSTLARAMSPTSLTDKEILKNAKETRLLLDFEDNGLSIVDILIGADGTDEKELLKANFESHKRGQTEAYNAFDKWMKGAMKRIRKTTREKIEAFPIIHNPEPET